MSIRAARKRFVAPFSCGRHDGDKKEETPEINVGHVEEKRRPLTTCFSTESGFLGMHTTRKQNKQKDRGGKSNVVRILTLSRHGKTIAQLGAILERHYFVVLRHGKAHKEMRRKILRIGEHTDRANFTKSPLPVLMSIF